MVVPSTRGLVRKNVAEKQLTIQVALPFLLAQLTCLTFNERTTKCTSGSRHLDQIGAGQVSYQGPMIHAKSVSTLLKLGMGRDF
jgi:hypothetical protein